MAARLRGALSTAAVLVLAALLAVLLAEGVVRALGWPARSRPMSRIADTKGADIGPGTLALLCYPSNPRGYFQIDLRRPEVAAAYRDRGMRNMDKVLPDLPWAVEMKYNSAVFRGGEIGPRRPGVRRLIVIGDSFNQGWGVREEDMYSRLLQRLLDEGGPVAWEVVNCARHDADFPRLWFLFRTVLAYEPDVVVYGMTLNDPVRSPRMQARLLESSPLVMVRGGPLLAPPPEAPPLGLRLFAVFSEQAAARRREEAMNRWYLDLFDDENHNGWQDTKGYIRMMDEQMKARGGRFLLALWPLLTGLEGDYPFDAVHRTVAAFGDKFGIARCDLLDALRGHRSADLWVHPVDRHPNADANRRAAAALAPAVRSLADGPAR